VLETSERLLKRLREYEGATISSEICDHDAMYQRGVPGALDHYLSVGRSAIAVLANAMIISGRDSFASVLDLPSGAGRITRHLAAFFRDAELFVGDANNGAREFAALKFGAKEFAFPANFIGIPGQRFELIFCGSLLTHLPAHRFVAATSWLIQALRPDGILVATTHGRRASFLQRTRLRYIDDDAWRAVEDDCRLHGFGFVETERNAAGPYGYSLSAPRWVMSLLEADSSCRVLGYQEAAWDDHQDAVIVQKRSAGKGRGEA
jgi:SAM-dependent methyltransferase